MIHQLASTTRFLAPWRRGARILFATTLMAPLLIPAASQAANPNAGRWRAQGGQLLFSGAHEFTRSYWTHESVQGDLYWTDGEDQRLVRASHAWETEVRPSVRVDQGRFAVRGPGQIVAYVGQIQDTPGLSVTTTGTSDPNAASGVFEPAGNPGQALSGWVLAGRNYSFDVALEQTARFNAATGYRLFQAPQEIEFELWYFAGPGGRVIGLNAAPQPGSGSSGGLFGGSSGKAIGTVEWVQCVENDSTRSSGDEAVVECGAKGLWKLDANGNRVQRIGAGDGVSSEEALETDAGTWARLALDDEGTEARITLTPATRVGVRGRSEEDTGSVVLFDGRLLTAQDLRTRVSLFESRTSVFETETANATVGAPGEEVTDQPQTAAYEIAFDAATGESEVVAGLGTVELGCKARPQPRRRVYEGDRARMEAECGVRFDFPTSEELEGLRRLAAYSPGQPAVGGGQAGGARAAGTYIGCYRDGGDGQGRDLDGELLFPSGLTPEICVNECAGRGYVFAGVQWGRSCLCGNSYGRHGESDACDSRCAGDSAKICGGYGANSIYATGAGGGAATEVKPPLGPAPRGVTLYQHGEFEGRSETFTQDVSSLGRTRIGNDEANSVRVGAGCRATLYEHSNFHGTTAEVTGDVPSLGATRLGNDEAGSLRVACD